MAGFFDKVVAGFDKGVTSVSTNSKNFVEKAKMNTAIQEAQRDKINLFKNLGELVYNLYISGVAEIEQCNGIYKEITALNEKIEECQKQIANLEMKKTADEPIATSGAVCPNCGAAIDDDAKFCAGCGMNLETECESDPESASE